MHFSLNIPWLLKKKNYFCRKNNVMAVYQIRINEKMSVGKSLVAFLQSIPQVVTFEKEEKPVQKGELYQSLDQPLPMCDL